VGCQKRKLGIALLGLGQYATEWLGPALRKTELCSLVGVITGNAEKAKEWSIAYHLAPQNLYDYDEFDDVATNEEIDVVYVVTPPALHVDFVIRAANAGKHVICEKPMATTVVDCDRMIAACRAAKVQLGIGYRLHFDPYHREMARLSHNEELGPFTKITGAFSVVLDQRGFRTNVALGGGPLLDTGIYPLHSACVVAHANPSHVTAFRGPKLKPTLFDEVEESISWSMEFPNGARCDATASFNQEQNYFRIEGDKGWVELKPAFSAERIFGATSQGVLNHPPVNQQALLMDDFADCIRTGRQSTVPGELGRRDIQIISSIYESADSGKRVRIPY